MKTLLVSLFVIAACTDFTDVPRDVCGNGLLEPGEDCDNEAANCVRCAVTCDAQGDCPSNAYACGVDGFCHAPGGQLADPTAPVTFQADDLRITDIDRDGAGDVLGVSKTSIIVRKGDAAGALGATTSFVTPAQSGPPAFGDLDGDERIDVSLSTPDGIVSYTSRFGTLSPVAIESPIFDDQTGEPLNFLRLFQVGTFELGGAIEAGGATQLVVISLATDPPRLDAAPPCFLRLGALAPNSISQPSVDIYRVTPDASFDKELLVSFLTAAGQPCVMSIRGNVLAGFTLEDVTPIGANTMTAKPILADIGNNDACPELVNSDGGGTALRTWPGRIAAGRCVLDPAGPDGALLQAATIAPASSVAIGRIELAPPIPGLTRDALVLSSGVYGHVPQAIPNFVDEPTLFELYSSNGRNLSFVATADLDNDNDLDAVLATSDQDDLDVLFRFPGGLQLLRIDTASQVSSLTLGDFDGNGVRDISYTETEGDHHDLMIAYGTSDRPLDPVQVATFSGVGSVSVLQFPDSVDTLAIADDLAIIQPGAGIDGGSLMSLLHGSPQRTMLSFFDPRSEATAQGTTLRGVVIGDFTDQPDALHRDLMAIGTPDPGSSTGMRAWRVAGTELGLDNQPNDGIAANGLADCTGSGVCVRNAEYLAFPIAEGRDVVLAVDREQPPLATLLDPFASAVSLSATDVPALVDVIPAGTTVRSLYAANLDDRDGLELIATFASETEGDVFVCSVDAGGVPVDCSGMTSAIRDLAPGVSACIDAAPITLGGGTTEDTPASDLVILCREGETTSLFKLSGGAIDGKIVGKIVALEAHAVGMQRIRAGDVTGDGVDDVVAVVGTGGSQSLIVFRQCDSRELGACQRTAAGEAP